MIGSLLVISHCWGTVEIEWVLDIVWGLKPLCDGIIRKMTSYFENIALDRVKVRLGLTEAQWTISIMQTS